MKRKRSIRITLSAKSEILGYNDMSEFIQFHHSFGLGTYFYMLPKNINENGDQVFSLSFYQRQNNIGILKYYSPDFTVNTIQVSYGKKKSWDDHKS